MRIRIATIGSIFALIAGISIQAQTGHTGHHPQPAASAASGAKVRGILLLAHGGSAGWNEEVKKIAAEVNKSTPVEIAFGMATKRNIQTAADRLIARGVAEIVAVPLFVSSHSSVITSTEYLLGLRKVAPAALAVFAKMDHGHGGHGSHQPADSSFDPTTPINSSVPIRIAPALNSHPLVAEILSSRASSISRTPSNEVVILVAHGPVSEEENNRWLADMATLASRIDAKHQFKRVEYLTVRDDAPDPIRSNATAELRRVVEKASAEGSRVLIVPLLLSFGGIEEGVKKRLDGLDYTMAGQGLLPDDRLAKWVLASAADGTGKLSASR